MEYSATAKYIRVSTRKLRLIRDSIMGLSPKEAIDVLGFTPKNAARPMSLVIRSAVANAIQKGAKEQNLVLKEVIVMGGPMMKRFHAVSRGMAHEYKKRMTHVRVTLSEKQIEVKPESKPEVKKESKKETA